MGPIRIATQLLFTMFITGALTLPVGAEEGKKPPAKETGTAQSDTTPQEAPPLEFKLAPDEDKDIWWEVSFDAAEDLQLTEKQVNQALEKLKKSDPPKAKQIEKLKDSDAEAFFKAVREEIDKQNDASKKPPTKKEKQLDKKYRDFLAWFEKKHPEDHSELGKIKTTDPEKFAQRTKALYKIYIPILEMEGVNPDLATMMEKNLELQKQRDALLLQIRISTAAEQAKLIDDLKLIISERFDTIVLEKQLQYEWQGKRIEQLTQKLQARTAALNTLKKSKDHSIEARLAELMKRTKAVNWN